MTKLQALQQPYSCQDAWLPDKLSRNVSATVSSQQSLDKTVNKDIKPLTRADKKKIKTGYFSVNEKPVTKLRHCATV